MDHVAQTGDKIVIINAGRRGSGSAAVAGYEYQIGVSIWLALDLILASKLTRKWFSSLPVRRIWKPR